VDKEMVDTASLVIVAAILGRSKTTSAEIKLVPRRKMGETLVLLIELWLFKSIKLSDPSHIPHDKGILFGVFTGALSELP
jgi:hypothetical protein